ncbi:MAG: DUF5666 domain-containing protein [bacterium]
MNQDKKNTFLPLIIAGMIIVIFSSFFGGMYYGKSNASQAGDKTFQNSKNNFQRNGNMPTGPGRMQVDRPVIGEVTTISGKMITINSQNDGSKTVSMADNTNITNNGADATLGDIKVGDTLMVTGQVNTDGSVKAQMVRINPTINTTRSPGISQ